MLVRLLFYCFTVCLINILWVKFEFMKLRIIKWFVECIYMVRMTCIFKKFWVLIWEKNYWTLVRFLNMLLYKGSYSTCFVLLLKICERFKCIWDNFFSLLGLCSTFNLVAYDLSLSALIYLYLQLSLNFWEAFTPAEEMAREYSYLV